MAWTTPRTWVSTEVVTASVMNTHIRDNFNETAPALATTGANRIFVSTGTNELTIRLPDAASVATSQTTTSTSYTDLTTSGPAVTADTGARALIGVGCAISNNTAAAKAYMSFAVSGATTESAGDSTALVVQSDSASQQINATKLFFHEALSSGTNTFTAKYKVSAGTGTFIDRHIFVIPLS